MLFHDWKGHGEDGLIVNVDYDGVVAGLLELEVVDFIDEGDTLGGVAGLERTGEDFAGRIHGQADADLEDVFASWAVGQRYEPNHLGV